MLSQSRDPDWEITTNTVWLREIERNLRVISWQNTKDGQSKNPRNYPEHRPLTAAERAEAESQAVQRDELRPDSMTIEEANAFLGW